MGVVASLLVITVLLSLTIPVYSGHIKVSRQQGCKIQQQAIVRVLQNERARDPEATMAEILSREDVQQIKCPAGGIYTPSGRSGINCSESDHSGTTLTGE